jgi:hypothetical protein
MVTCIADSLRFWGILVKLESERKPRPARLSESVERSTSFPNVGRWNCRAFGLSCTAPVGKPAPQQTGKSVLRWLRLGTAAILFFALAASFCGNSVLAADKSGVSPNSISLPKGPGSIEGLGESFQPTLNTGTAKYGIALKVPPGTAGQTPDLRLAYEGGGGNGSLGFGWQLSIPSIQRRTDKGIPFYGTDPELDRVDVFINDMKEELVPQSNGDWFCKNEGTFIRYRFVPSLAHPMGEGRGEGGSNYRQGPRHKLRTSRAPVSPASACSTGSFGVCFKGYPPAFPRPSSRNPCRSCCGDHSP